MKREQYTNINNEMWINIALQNKDHYYNLFWIIHQSWCTIHRYKNGNEHKKAIIQIIW